MKTKAFPETGRFFYVLTRPPNPRRGNLTLAGKPTELYKSIKKYGGKIAPLRKLRPQ